METVSCEGKDINSHKTLAKECMSETEAAIHDSRPDRIIFPDPTPKVFNSVFYRVYPRLLPILVMDNVQEFLRFCQNDMWAIALDFITPQTFLHMILQNSVRCAKVVLEGQAPELNGIRAYPNCATQYGFFPLHQAAEIFSVDMIKLLLQHGASTDVRTFGSEVVNDLLPLHVAVENTCMHKYLDDNLFPYELNPAYCKADTKDIYKLIHLLCLPEMKIFLDTTRLLAKHTNDLIGEICNYIRQGKLIHTAVLLLAAQGHIQRSRSCKRNGDRKPDGFSYIIKYIAEHSNAVKLEMVPNKREHQMVKEKYILSTLWLVEAISVAGGRLNEYIQGHSKVPHDEVLEHVSSILKSYDFCPTGESISIENLKLSPYNLPPPVRNNPKKNGKKAARTVATGEKLIVGKDLPRSWDLVRKRKSFFPFWRSALALGFPVKIYPGHAIDDKHLYDFKALCQNNVSEKACSPTPNHNIGLLTSTPQPTSNCQSKRQFGTSATAINYQSKSLFGNAALTSNYQSKRLFGTAALILLKVLKKA